LENTNRSAFWANFESRLRNEDITFYKCRDIGELNYKVLVKGECSPVIIVEICLFREKENTYYYRDSVWSTA